MSEKLRQPDFFEEAGNSDSVSQETEARIRSKPGERMVTKKDAQRERAIGFGTLRRIQKMLGKKIEKDKHPKLDL